MYETTGNPAIRENLKPDKFNKKAYWAAKRMAKNMKRKKKGKK